MATVTTRVQTVEVSNVVQVIVTETQIAYEDTYVREIRVMTQDDEETTPQQAFVVRLVGSTLMGVQLTAPPQEF